MVPSFGSDSLPYECGREGLKLIGLTFASLGKKRETKPFNIVY